MKKGRILDTRELRNTLGQFATGVCVLTTESSKGPIGMTVNSFAAVSLEPALVLWSFQNNSDCFEEFTQCERYGISVLQQSQEVISNRYARSMDHQVESSDLTHDANGTPLIKDALATFSCRAQAIHEGGDHHIIVGEVEAFTTVDGEPLLFFGGGYTRLA